MRGNEKREVNPVYRVAMSFLILSAIGGAAFAMGMICATRARADNDGKKPRVIYPKHTELDFQGTEIEGEIRNPGEFYFEHRKEEKFDSLVKRRPNFHREMLRNVVMSK